MESKDLRTLRVARIVLEALTPLSITTGGTAGSFDTALALDANGLPTIPAPSLKGVLRNAYRSRFAGETDPWCAEPHVFGFMADDKGAPSKLQTSWGWCHDAKGRPVLGRLEPREGYEGRFLGQDLVDPILVFLRGLDATPVVRERVRLNGRGTADGHGKFDRSVVPAGARFTVELTYLGLVRTDASDRIVWDRLLGILTQPGLRLGGATRSGLGLVAPVIGEGNLPEVRERVFTLDAGAIAELRAFRAATATSGSLDAFHPVARDLADACGAQGGSRRLMLDLEAQGTWQFGGGDLSLDATEVDRAPKTEVCIKWTRAGSGWSAELEAAQQAPLLIPGSSIKGALRHRTLFHFRRRLLGLPAAASLSDVAVDDAMAALFGREKKERNGRESGRAGLVIVDDVFKSRTAPDFGVQTINHVSIDRFSGGARNGVLFDEEVLVGGRLSLTLWLAPQFDALPEALRLAFEDTLADLKRGWLPLGAAASRGHGRFCEVEAS